MRIIGDTFIDCYPRNIADTWYIQRKFTVYKVIILVYRSYHSVFDIPTFRMQFLVWSLCVLAVCGLSTEVELLLNPSKLGFNIHFFSTINNTRQRQRRNRHQPKPQCVWWQHHPRPHNQQCPNRLPKTWPVRRLRQSWPKMCWAVRSPTPMTNLVMCSCAALTSYKISLIFGFAIHIKLQFSLTYKVYA